MALDRCCMKKKTPEQTLFEVFENLQLEQHKKTVLQNRYLRVLEDFHSRAKTLSWSYYSVRTIVTVGSILVPAFLSIQTNPASNNIIYWTTWIISLAVTICNGFMTLYKLDKKYFFINTTLEMLHSEGWQYIGLTGRYVPKDAIEPPSHENQFIVFFHMAEKIKMRQVEEEFWKFTDTSGVGNATNSRPLSTAPTPATQQGQLASLPPEKKTVIESWLKEMADGTLANGLQPRIIPPQIDGGSESSGVQRTTEETSLPGESDMSKSPTSKSTNMRPTRLPSNNTIENEFFSPV